jgi:hypothetical protein
MTRAPNGEPGLALLWMRYVGGSASARRSAPSSPYLAESYRVRLPEADIGKSCVRFKRLDDPDE